jgi:hypothetical protein
MMYLRIAKVDNKGEPAYTLHVGQEGSESLADNRWENTHPVREWVSSAFTERELSEAYFGYWV